MGGARCSYRTCLSRSNRTEQVHMFHFPVFDKPRCHQWIVNAQRLNFLNLKVSQLKNRVICEHHFKDSDFMNYTKGRLKSSAVPTEIGPNCAKQKKSEQVTEMFPINAEDIEYNDQLTRLEKKAHFPVKYGDFLVNDVTEPLVLPNEMSPSEPKKKKSFIDTYYTQIKSSIYDKFDESATSIDQNIMSDNNNMPSELTVTKYYEDTKDIKPSVQVTRVFPSSKVKILSEKKISQPVRLRGELQTVSPSIILKVPDKKSRSKVEINNTQVQTNYVNIEIPSVNNMPVIVNNVAIQEPNEFTSANQIFNLEEYNLSVSNAVTPIKSDLYVLSPGTKINEVSAMSNILPIPTIAADMPDISTLGTNEQFVPDSATAETLILSRFPVEEEKILLEEEKIPVEEVKVLLKEEKVPVEEKEVLVEEEKITDKIVVESGVKNTKKKQIRNTSLKLTKNIPVENQAKEPDSPSKAVSRTKLPPEKVAEIVEKRKYNMKLRDIITSCIDKLDDETAPGNADAKKSINKKVSEHLSNLNLPIEQENFISYFEARLQKMEDVLLNKIDQNTQRIVELQKIVKPSRSKKSTFTQTYVNMDTKKHLYQQLSQFLTPEANSMVYEELFINQFSQKVLNKDEPPKKRKRR